MQFHEKKFDLFDFTSYFCLENSLIYLKTPNNFFLIYQKEDLQVVQTTLLATRTTALMMSLQLLPGQNLN